MKKLLLLMLLLGVTGIYAKPKIYVAVLDYPGQSQGLYQFRHDTTWTHFGWKNIRLNAISIRPDAPATWFVAAGNGVLRSCDAGETWRITTDWTITEVQDVIIDPFDSKNILLASAYGVWKTSDQGATWKPFSNGIKQLPYSKCIEADVSQPNHFVLGAETGLYITVNGGKKWNTVGPPDISIIDLQQNSKHPQHWIAGTEEKGVLISENNATDWHFAKGEIANQPIYAVATDPSAPERMAAGGFRTGIFTSLDHGERWTKHLPDAFQSIHALQFDPEILGRLWVGTIDKGVFYTDDFGKSWHYAGLTGARIWDILILGGN